MIIMFLGIAMLSGWLVVELKDFFSSGGMGNSLAFTLLKIIFIFTLIMGNVILILAPHLVDSILKTLINDKATPAENKITTPAKVTTFRVSQNRQNSINSAKSD
jgi:hypothetical protein